MQRRHVSLATEKGRGIPGLEAAGVPAVFCDAVRVDLGECTLLYVSGRLSTDADGQIAGRTMGEQTRNVLENRLYSWGEEVSSNALEVHIHHLRRKLGPEFIKTVRGVRYRVDNP